MFNSNAGTLPVSIPIGVGNGGGFGNGSGFDDIIALAIIAMIFGWNNGGIFGGGGSNGAQMNYVLSSDFATIQRQLSDGFNSIDNALDAQNNGICNLGYTQLQLNNQLATQLADCCCQTQQNIKDTQYAIATTGAGIQGAIKDCCCENEKIALQNRYESAQNQCATIQAISDSTKQIIDYMANKEAQALRDENFALRLSASQEHQNNYLIGQLRPAPTPSYVVPNPYCNCNNGYGYGFYNGTTIA